MKSPTPESVLALVLDELTRDRQNNGDFATHGGGRKFLADELQRLTTHIVNPVPGMTVKQQKQAIARSAIRLAALAVRFVLDLRLDRYLDLEPVPEGYTPIDLDNFPVEFEGRKYRATGRLIAREYPPATRPLGQNEEATAGTPLPEDSPLRKLGLEESFPAAPDHLSPSISNAEALARPWRPKA